MRTAVPLTLKVIQHSNTVHCHTQIANSHIFHHPFCISVASRAPSLARPISPADPSSLAHAAQSKRHLSGPHCLPARTHAHSQSTHPLCVTHYTRHCHSSALAAHPQSVDSQSIVAIMSLAIMSLAISPTRTLLRVHHRVLPLSPPLHRSLSLPRPTQRPPARLHALRRLMGAWAYGCMGAWSHK